MDWLIDHLAVIMFVAACLVTKEAQSPKLPHLMRLPAGLVGQSLEILQSAGRGFV